MKAGAFVQFNKTFPWKSKISWLDNTGVIKLEGNRIVKISLQTHGHSGRYEKFVVTVLDKNDGQIDVKGFLFSDYLDTSKRKDNRNDYNPNNQGGYHVWFNSNSQSQCFEWYIAEPSDVTPLVEAIEDYIELFK